MQVIKEKTGKNGMVFRIVDDANPAYKYHDYSVEVGHFDEGCTWWSRVGGYYTDIESVEKHLDDLCNNYERYSVEIQYGDGWHQAYFGASFESVERAKITASYWETNGFLARIVDTLTNKVVYHSNDDKEVFM